jgi:N-acylglucosamine 2-epimerase
MKRRSFLQASTVTALSSHTAGCRFEKVRQSLKPQTVTDSGTLANFTLEQLRDQYHHDLFDDFLPFMDKYVIDHEYGGFMCNTDRDGTNLTTNKNSWYEGRGIWVYSFLYNKLDQNSSYLEVARKSVEFIMKHKPSGLDLWPYTYSREGKPLNKSEDVYGDLFIAAGLTEFSKTPGNESYFDVAKDILKKTMTIYDSPDYAINVYYGPNVPIKAPRVLGHWMVILNLLTSMLEYRKDAELEALTDHTVDAIMNHHFNTDYNLMNEVTNHDLTRPNNDFAQFSYLGHAIETLWMVLYEAVRRKDKNLFDTTTERYRRHVEVSWDDVYGGAFRSLDHVDNYIWKTDKVLWLQEEVLIGTLCLIEHTGDQWAKDWFSKVFIYVQDKYPLKKHGFPLWITSADRKVTFVPHADRVENFHHPRHLMLNLLSIERMLEGGGKISGLFST